MKEDKLIPILIAVILVCLLAPLLRSSKPTELELAEPVKKEKPYALVHINPDGTREIIGVSKELADEIKAEYAKEKGMSNKTTTHTIKYEKNKQGKWDFSIYHSNGNWICGSAPQGYSNLADCIQSATNLKKAFEEGTVQNEADEEE